MTENKRVIVGMSGGVDSAVAAYLLKSEGYDVTGLTLRTWESSNGEESRCCEIDDARRIAGMLGIPYHVRNVTGDFKDKVTTPFINDYICGMTPNPCIECNRKVKWVGMIYMADVLGAACVATGHYASVVKLDNGRYSVRQAEHADKDQTYMLYKLTQEQLARTLMPLGKLSKDEVRKIAKDASIPVADKPDSQEICFVNDDDYARYIAENHTGKLPGEGDFVDEEGRVLGRHKGIIHYTIGQRKGLGLPLGYPAYVKRIDREKNEVVIAENNALFSNVVICRDVNMMSIPVLNTGEKLRCRAKIRYHHKLQAAMAEMTDENTLKIEFDEPVRAAAPGQSAVMYDADDNVIGGGIIHESA
ncbi:MAG: tRNA 2-thiouridine(34) synthase MnmA [Lachnospiraceae bacterium]|nr:tRNA 2-thiouridine(34) synthase MnmA [Lachnospiraceae bacterium]